MSCRVCSHPGRVEIEAAIGDAETDLYELATRFGVTRAAVVKHMRCPKRADEKATPSPSATAGSRPAERRARRCAPTSPPVVADRRSVLEDEESPPTEDPPATSRSAEIRTRAPKTAREKVERLVDSLQTMLDSVSKPSKPGEQAPLGAQLAVLRAMVQPLRLLGTFTGEIGASETTVASSPFYKRVRAAVIDALRQYPDAARAVVGALERVERGADQTDLEAAAE